LIVSYNNQLTKTKSNKQFKIFQLIASEKNFLNSDFGNVNSIQDLLYIIHNSKHSNISELSCKQCKKIAAQLENSIDIRPKFGNLMHILENEVQEEKNIIEKKRLPSQNDLTRFALKSAVLEFYKNKNISSDFVISDNSKDGRLIPELAPDFDVIYNIWLDKLLQLNSRDDKYRVEIEEINKAKKDVDVKMQGSAFEKQLDRFRKEFMEKL
jgi:hypothetical protein